MPTIRKYDRLDIKILIQKCIENDPLGWSEFTMRFSPLVFKAIRKRLENHNFNYSKEDIEDLRQGFFIKLWRDRNLEKVKDASNINYWICMVAANFATDFYRRSKKDIMNNAVSIFEDVAVNNKKISLKSYIKSNISTPRKKIEKKFTNELIEGLFKELNPKEKMALKLNIYHNKKHREISRILNLSLGNVASILRRAKIKLRKRLQENK